MAPQAVDYSFSRPNPADLAASGYVGALRYLCPLPNVKAITGDEIASLHANGLAIGFVWESGASRAGQGVAAGRVDAITANLQADDLGVPDTTTLYFAVDYDANPNVITAYFQGVQAASKRPVGGYGSYRVVEHLLDNSLVAYAWQTVAWSHGQRSQRAHLFQRADAAANPPPGTDVNDVLQDDWGQWPATGTLTPAQETDDMTPDEHAALIATKDGVDALYQSNARIELALAGLHPGGTVDPIAVAKAIVDAGVGKQVADELAKRLAN